MSKYTTGELAKLCNVSVRTVQFYDTKGLLSPTELSDGGRRLYSDEDLRKFQLVCTLRSMGLSLGSIKNTLESELSAEILTLLLDEQTKLLDSEIDERQKQLAMISTVKQNITGRTAIPVNAIIDIDEIVEKKNKALGRKKLAMVHVAVGIAAALGFLFMAWLAVSQIWWGLAIYITVAAASLAVSAFQLKDTELTCPKCNSIFRPPLRRVFFSTGSSRLRWMTCPKCGNKDWCVIRKQAREV